MPSGAKLVVDNDNGSTRVTVDPNATDAIIEYTRVAFGGDQAAADALLAEIVVTVTEPTEGDNALRIDAPQPTVAAGNTNDLQFSLQNDELNVTGILVGTQSVALVRMRITLPPGHEVEVTNNNGAIRTVNLDAVSTLTGENVTVRSMNATADLTITTNNGIIDVEEHHGNLIAETANGVIDIDDLYGSLDAEAANGPISISVRTLEADQHIYASTQNGVINLELPQDINALLDARTGNGAVVFNEDEFDATSNIQQTLTHVVATLNSGGPSVEVQTVNGLVTVDVD